MKCIVLFCTFFLLATGSSIACSCVGLPPLKELSQLQEYRFIALVTITDDGDMPADPYKESGTLKFRIITLFKGKPVTELLERSKNSSCDIGITKGETWILFAREGGGQLQIQPCDRNVRYRSAKGERDWWYKRGMEDLDKLAELYQHPAPIYPDGVHTELYANGQKELQENYKDHQLQGERKLWYANGQLSVYENYVNGRKEGKSNWWYPSGQLAEESFYTAGKPFNVSRFYYDTTLIPGMKALLVPMIYPTEDSLVNEFKKTQVHFERVFALDGTLLIHREYARSGIVREEYIVKNNSDTALHIRYHENGRISTLSYDVAYRSVGRFYEFNKDGSLKRSGVDEGGRNVVWDPPVGK